MNAPTTSRPHLFGLLAGLFLSTGLCLASLVLARAWTRIAESSAISVTGSAHMNVHSDLAVWHAAFSVDAPTLLEAQQQLRGDLAKVAAFLQARGLTEFTVQPVQIREITAKHSEETNEDSPVTVRVGYRLTQAVEVRSKEVDRLPQLAGETSELLQQGVAFMSTDIQFIYTKAGDAKIEMMAEAAKDARIRAGQIAAQGGGTIRELRAAKMGVVQINPLYSSATSWEGNNDNTSLDKTITATVAATFALK